MVDWPGFALITYAFLLVLLLAGIILRSLRTTKGHYQNILEEKEQKLVAMQMDLEDTLEAIEEQAAAFEALRSAAVRQGEDSQRSVQQRLMEFQEVLGNLQIRLSRLEQTPRYQSVGQAGMAQEACGDKLGAPEPPRKILSEAKAVQKKSTEPCPCAADFSERTLPRQRAMVLLKRGMTIDQVSRELRCSWTEATLLYSQWRRGCLKEDLEAGS